MERFNERPYDIGKRRVVVVEDDMSDDEDSSQVINRKARSLVGAAHERRQRQLSENVADLISTIRNDVKTRQDGNTTSYISDAVMSMSQDIDASSHSGDGLAHKMQRRGGSYMDRDHPVYKDKSGNHSGRWTDAYRNKEEGNFSSKKLRTHSPMFRRTKLDEPWKEESDKFQVSGGAEHSDYTSHRRASTHSQDDEITNRHEKLHGSRSVGLSFENLYERRPSHDIPTIHHRRKPSLSSLRRSVSDSDEDESILDRYVEGFRSRRNKTDNSSVNRSVSRSPVHKRKGLRLDRQSEVFDCHFEEGKSSVATTRRHRRNSGDRVIAEILRKHDIDDNQSVDDLLEHRLEGSTSGYRERGDSLHRNRLRSGSPPYKRRSIKLEKRRESSSSNQFEDPFDHKYRRRVSISSQGNRSISPQPWFNDRSPSASQDSFGGYSPSLSRNIAAKPRNRSRSEESPSRSNRNLYLDSEDELYGSERNLRSRDDKTQGNQRKRWRGSRDLDSPDSDSVHSWSTRHEPSRYR